jgi:hypothetical protein
MSRLASATDVKYVGNEPILGEGCGLSDLARAFNWYNYVCTSDQAKEFIVTYLKTTKFNKNDLKKIGKAKLSNSIGWMCRILSEGGQLPDGYEERMMKRIQAAIDETKPDVEVVVEDAKPVISIQERVRDKTAELIGDLEAQLDTLFKTSKLTFDAVSWFRQNDIKPQIAQKIAEYYKPLYSEIYDAIRGKDLELKEAYSRWKKPALKTYLETVRDIIAAAEGRAVIARAARKPRKKKVKPISDIVSKVKYKEFDKELNIKSIKATEIVGVQQLWVFNTKYRKITVYNAIGPSGLSVKGTTLSGFDEKTSITKTVRKPEVTLPNVLNSGKVALRKLMDNIKAKSSEANGRINSDVVLLRVIK